jgi:hypothetical protein
MAVHGREHINHFDNVDGLLDRERYRQRRRIENNVTEIRHVRCCENCYRSQIEGDSSVVVEEVLRQTNYHYRYKFSRIPRCNQTNRREGMPIYLCQECRRYICSNDGNGWRWYWAAWLWIVLSDFDVLQCETKFMWEILPHQWRLWWNDQLKLLKIKRGHVIVAPYGELIERNDLLSKFEVMTEKYQRIKQNIEALKIKLLLPHMKEDYSTIQCPWGCSEFLESCGEVSLYNIIAHYINPFVWKSKMEATKKVNVIPCRQKDPCIGTRNDYLTWNGFLLPNTKDERWKLRRGIVINNEKGPMVLTCHDHDGGSYERYVHVMMNPVNGLYASENGDQLSMAVVRSRIVKPMKAHKYTTTYQVVKALGGYNGIDTFDVRKVGCFNVISDILLRNECLTLNHRYEK